MTEPAIKVVVKEVSPNGEERKQGGVQKVKTLILRDDRVSYLVIWERRGGKIRPTSVSEDGLTELGGRRIWLPDYAYSAAFRIVMAIFSEKR